MIRLVRTERNASRSAMTGDFAMLFNARFDAVFRGLDFNHSQSIFSFNAQIKRLRFQTRRPRIAEKV